MLGISACGAISRFTITTKDAEMSSLSVGPNVAVGLITLSSICPPSFLMKSHALVQSSSVNSRSTLPWPWAIAANDDVRTTRLTLACRAARRTGAEAGRHDHLVCVTGLIRRERRGDVKPVVASVDRLGPAVVGGEVGDGDCECVSRLGATARTMSRTSASRARDRTLVRTR